MNTILIQISRTFREGMLPLELYEATRGTWVIGKRREEVEYAVAVADGEIREVYRVERWDKAGTHKYKTRDQNDVTVEGRWEFSGQVAEDAVRDKCVGYKIKKLGQSPIQYIELSKLIDSMSQRKTLTMKPVEFERELERVGLAQKHADEAFTWIREHGKKGVHDILYYRNRPIKKGAWAVRDKEGHRYFMKQATLLAYLFARKAKGELDGDPPFDKEWKSDKIIRHMVRFNNKQILEKLGIDDVVQYDENGKEIASLFKVDRKRYSDEINILEQFKQIIFYGPPGTGKTRRAKLILARLFNFSGNDAAALHKLQEEKDKDRYWDIVQFHPSYNYEDFVRGIKVEARGEDGIAYITENRVFGEMCERARKNSDKKYALIIDEINRANVSAVLGELIYALEYRDKPVNTPYKVNGKRDISVPNNLYIIGTMNTADRTIGQIDYAVRRRFAFVHCPPDGSVIENEEANKFFGYVDAIFNKEYISQDYDANDVRIGHSYFLENGIELANKIIYQVIPILREYVKDGVLRENAKNEIDKIKRRAEELRPATPGFYWTHPSGHSGHSNIVKNVAFSIIEDFIKSHLGMKATKLEEDFNKVFGGCVRRKDTIPENRIKRYFYESPVILESGEAVCISSHWGAARSMERIWNKFKEHMEKYDYSIIEK